MLVSEVFCVGKEGLADGPAAAAMDRPRTVPFTANPFVVLCTEYAPTVAQFYFLNIRFSFKHGTFENRIICGAKKFSGPDLNQRPQCYVVHTVQNLLLLFDEFLDPNRRFILKVNSNVREGFID
jgi:hypothetical protein